MEYVRGVPVVKTFGQTVFSFKRFKAAIDEYEKWTLGYTKNMLMPMVAFTTAANGIFAALIIAAFGFTKQGVTDEFIRNKTVLIIAHRMRTVDGVDKIVVLKDGKVAETGTPDELKKANGIYKHMADMQLQSDNWKYQ